MARRAVIITSHAVEALASIADQAIFLQDGRVEWEGFGSEVLQSERVVHLWTGTSSDPSDQQKVSGGTTCENRDTSSALSVNTF